MDNYQTDQEQKILINTKTAPKSIINNDENKSERSSVSSLGNLNQDSVLPYMDDADLPAVSLYMAGLASFDTQDFNGSFQAYQPELVNDSLSTIKDLSHLREIATFLIFGYCRKLNESNQPYYDIVFTISSYYDFNAEEFLEIHSNLFFKMQSVGINSYKSEL